MISYKQYNASNKAGTRLNFDDRKAYEEELVPFIPIPGMDFWTSSYYYGRIDDAANSIFLSEGFLKPVSSEPEIYALNFVSDAFHEWKAYYAQIIKQKGTGELLSAVRVKKAWIPMHELYHTYITNKFSKFLAYCSQIQINKEIKNFEDFMDYLVKFNNIDKEFPICRSDFIVSKYSNPFISGLVIDLKGLPQDKDYEKQRIIADNDFELYARTLNKFGFRVNKNAPWVIIADVKSKRMKKYIEKYTNKNLWDEFYFKSYESDLDILKRYAVHFYNNFVISTKHPCKQRDIVRVNDVDSIEEPNWVLWYVQLKVSNANYLG